MTFHRYSAAPQEPKTDAKHVEWILFPMAPQRHPRGLAGFTRRLCRECRLTILDDGCLAVEGSSALLTQEYLKTILPFVSAIWNELKRGRT